ncbi:MAG: CRISPR-associated exonuclease Cas4 [Verrucomicrobiota bacterium]|jgi:ATP-dependent exoDNAse (exonuclease V) beta subunit
MSTLPVDQTQRERFAQELERNFSVIAAAGAGKTTAITDRIVEIARRKPEWLPRLVVVTFTNRAADEMQQRARQRIFEARLPLETLTTFNRAFFGTIHSFCTKLLSAHGHHLGLPSRLELISDDDELWTDFVQRTVSLGETLSPENRGGLFRHVQLRDVMELGRRGNLPLELEHRETNCPPIVDLARLRNYPARAGSTRIEAMQVALRDWEARYRSDADFVPLIECTTGGKFGELWEETFREFNDWLSCCALSVAAEVQAKYRRFRAERGAVTFDDQIALALELTRVLEVIARIRAKDFIVILDEAQDTDPQQFEILTEIARQDRHLPPRAGRFCMVGDFQQSIYKDRADLKQYQRVHEALINSDTGEELRFSVTFRLDDRQVEFVNECFRDILNAEGQVGFIELSARPERLPGQVVRLDIAPEVREDATDSEKVRAEANELARWIARTGRDNLRARSWEQVAILCPRRKWFRPIADALRKIDIDSQIQSETDVKADSPAHAWFTALITIMTQPHCAFEIVGVLREVFGISDHDLAIFAAGRGERFQIQTPINGKDRVSAIVDLLAHLHADVADRPLFSAVQQMVEATHLRERLRTLPAEDFEELDAELDELLQAAAAAESDGETLEEFAELLRANFTSEREARVPRVGAIQLITCQKAKGLEWDAVIVPFFSRQVYTSDDNFPRIITVPGEQRAIVAFSKADLPSETKEAMKLAQLQDWERLLYVALTRARHTLVLARDHALFAKRGGAAHSDSLTKWFRTDRGGINEMRLGELEIEPRAEELTRVQQLRTATAEIEAQQFVFFPEGALPSAQKCAEQFSRRFFPSNFTTPTTIVAGTGADVRKEIERDFRAATLPSAATRYGVWWHEFVQQIPWNSEPAKWDEIFAVALRDSPDRARSTREWQTLRSRVAKLPDFPAQFAENNAVMAHAEMPFLWRLSAQTCLEGVVDLALFAAADRKWFLLDWKTNEITSDKIDNLRAHYRPQIAAYWRAVSAMTQSSVTAAIYATTLGEFLIYENDDLGAAEMPL